MINFLNALETVNFTEPIIDELHRLYYDDNGFPLFYSTEDLDGNYITVSKEEHTLGRYDVTIVDGEILYPMQYVYQKLTPQEEGTTCHNDDVSIISNEGQAWGLTRYE